MSKNAPDTRGKLDNNKSSKFKLPRRKKIKVNNLKDIKENPGKYKFEKKKTKGQLFKEKTGYSKTMKRLLHRYGLTGNMLDNYRELRKKRKLKEKQKRQEKHRTSVTFKRLNGKASGKGKSTQKTKKK